MVQTQAHLHGTTILAESDSPKRGVGGLGARTYFNGKERKEKGVDMVGRIFFLN